MKKKNNIILHQNAETVHFVMQTFYLFKKIFL